MADFSKIFILAEDARQQLFVLRYLYQVGFKAHAIDRQPLPDGTGGAGEHWVRQHYAAVLERYRRRAANAKTALIVVIDADTQDSSLRSHQLEEALRKSGVAPRKKGEPILHLIPRRNIETWILHLSGKQVDEETDYHDEKNVDDLIPEASATFFQWTAQPPANCLPSLLAGIEEAKRLA